MEKVTISMKKPMMIVGDLREYFSRWGKVTQCIIKLDRFTGNSRGFGFVTMESEECVNKVLGVPEHQLKNKKIDPKKAKPSREPLRKVFVGGIDPGVTEDQIREYFGVFGKVETLDLPFDPNKGKRKHYIFVSFATEAAARKAIAKERQEIFGRQCDVRFAVTREQANKQRALRYGCYLDPYMYANFGDFANPYPMVDPYGLIYGYNYVGNTAYGGGGGGYQGVGPNQFRGLPGVPKSGNQRNPGPGGLTNRVLSTGANTQNSLSNHTPQQAQQQHGSLGFGHMNHQMDHHHHHHQQHPHHAALSTGLDYGTPVHPATQPTPGMLASAAAAVGYPHP